MWAPARCCFSCVASRQLRKIQDYGKDGQTFTDRKGEQARLKATRIIAAASLASGQILMYGTQVAGSWKLAVGRRQLAVGSRQIVESKHNYNLIKFSHLNARILMHLASGMVSGCWMQWHWQQHLQHHHQRRHHYHHQHQQQQHQHQRRNCMQLISRAHTLCKYCTSVLLLHSATDCSILTALVFGLH